MLSIKLDIFFDKRTTKKINGISYLRAAVNL